MPDSLVEVLKTYPRRAFSSWVTGAAVVIFVVSAIPSWGIRRHPAALVSQFGPKNEMIMTLSFLGFMLWNHFRDLIVNSDRRLRPGAIGPNVAVFAGFSGLLTIIWPAVILPTVLQSLGLIAVTTTWFAYLGLCALTGSQILTFAGLIPYLWICLMPLSDNAKAFVTGQHPGLAGGVIIIAVGVIAGVVIRMILLTEEHPWFCRQWRRGSGGLRPRATGEVNRAWSESGKDRLFGWLGSGSPIPIYIPSDSSLWDRARRWRMLTRDIVRKSFFVTGIIMASFLIAWRVSFDLAGGGAGGLVIMAILLNILPAISVSQMWLNQWRFLQTESVRPILRGSLLRELGVAVAVNIAQCWCIGALTLVVATAMVGRIDGTAVALVLLSSAISQIFTFGVTVWLLSFRLTAGPILAGIAALLPIFVVVLFICEPEFAPYRAFSLLAAVSMAGAGMYISRAAYKLWLVTEWG